MRSFTTPPAFRTWPLACKRYLATQPDFTTRPPVQALLSNTTGNHNTADGDNALVHNTTGILNTAVGGHALDQNITGSSNVALGFQAGFNITGNGNVCIGQNIVGLAGESNVTRIGNIGSTAQANGVFVTVGAGGKLGFQVSLRRYKDDIKPMDKASEALFALKILSASGAARTLGVPEPLS